MKKLLSNFPVIIGAFLTGIAASVVLALLITALHNGNVASRQIKELARKNHTNQAVINKEFVKLSRNGVIVAIDNEILCRNINSGRKSKNTVNCKKIVEIALDSNSSNTPGINKKANPIVYELLAPKKLQGR